MNEIEKAVATLRRHNEWRRDRSITSLPFSPIELGLAIDIVTAFVGKHAADVERMDWLELRADYLDHRDALNRAAYYQPENEGAWSSQYEITLREYIDAQRKKEGA